MTIIFVLCKTRDCQITDMANRAILCQNWGLVFEERIIDDIYENK